MSCLWLHEAAPATQSVYESSGYLRVFSRRQRQGSDLVHRWALQTLSNVPLLPAACEERPVHGLQSWSRTASVAGASAMAMACLPVGAKGIVTPRHCHKHSIHVSGPCVACEMTQNGASTYRRGSGVFASVRMRSCWHWTRRREANNA